MCTPGMWGAAMSETCTCAWHMGMRDPDPGCTYDHAKPQRDKVTWSWDNEVNMGYLRILPGREVHTTHMKSGNGDTRINVDYDEFGYVVGVEVFG